MLAWYLEPEVSAPFFLHWDSIYSETQLTPSTHSLICIRPTKLDVNSSPIPHHYIFRRFLNSKGIKHDRTPILLRNHSDLARSEDLPDPRYLALHAAIGGVLVKSGCVFYVIRLFNEMKKATTLAPDGSSNVVHLFASHSIGKVSIYSP
jgi:hypothetical protein